MYTSNTTPQNNRRLAGRFTGRRALALSVVGFVGLAACGTDGDDSADAVTQPTPADAAAVPATDAPVTTDPKEEAPVATDAVAEEAPVSTDAVADEAPLLQLQFDGLPVLGDAAVYEGWAIVDDAPVSTGRFLIDDNGAIVDEDGNVDDHFDVDATDASAIVITIEPTVDPDPAPSAIHILAGDVVDGSAELTIGHPAAIGTDFSEAAGTVKVAAPTAPGVEGAETAGAWFIADGEASLDLPVLPEGWAYEGWVVLDGQPLSTGRFIDPAAADDFSGFSGPEAGPNVPGEDFIVNAPEGLEFPRSTVGETVVISVEPDPDDSPAPFTLKPLVGQIADGAEAGSDHVLNVNAEGVPTGIANIFG